VTRAFCATQYKISRWSKKQTSPQSNV
jgi:hypothetical protein